MANRGRSRVLLLQVVGAGALALGLSHPLLGLAPTPGDAFLGGLSGQALIRVDLDGTEAAAGRSRDRSTLVRKVELRTRRPGAGALVDYCPRGNRRTIYRAVVLRSAGLHAGRAPDPLIRLHDVDRIGYDVDLEAGGVVFDASLPLGSVAHLGSDAPLSTEQYLSLSDSAFDC